MNLPVLSISISSSTYDPTEAFQTACKTIIDNLPERYLVKEKYIEREARHPHGWDQVGKTVEIEHPDIDKRWGTKVELSIIYFGKEDVFNGLRINPRVLFQQALLAKYTEFKVEKGDGKPDWKFVMAYHLSRELDVGDYKVKFDYYGPNMDPKRSKEEFDGGDEVFYGLSSKNPDPNKNLFTRRSDGYVGY